MGGWWWKGTGVENDVLNLIWEFNAEGEEELNSVK